MKTIQKSLNSVLKKDGNIINLEKILIVLWVGGTIISPVIFITTIAEIFGDGIIGTMVATVFPGIFIIILLYGFYQAYMFPFHLMKKLYNKGVSIIELGETEQKRVSNVREILESIDTLYSAVRRFIWMKKVFGFFLTRQTQRVLGMYSELICMNAVNLIRDLQGDLIHEVHQRQSLLAEAQSELSHHVTGTSELGHVSELQRARLDRQIEQFEELQRVIMKV